MFYPYEGYRSVTPLDAAGSTGRFSITVLLKKNGFLPKTGIPGHFGSKQRYILKPSTNHTPGALRLASLISYLFLAWKGQVNLVLSTLSVSFQLTVFGEFWANQRPYMNTYHTTSHSDGQIYGCTYEVSSNLTRIGCCCLLKWYTVCLLYTSPSPRD